jgi:hypothetical protein
MLSGKLRNNLPRSVDDLFGKAARGLWKKRPVIRDGHQV